MDTSELSRRVFCRGRSRKQLAGFAIVMVIAGALMGATTGAVTGVALVKLAHSERP